MGDFVPDAPAGGDFVPDQPQQVAAATSGFVPDKPQLPQGVKPVPAQPPADQGPEYPGIIESLVHGIGAGLGEAEESKQAIEGEQMTPPSAKLTQGPEAQPLAWGDILHPYQAAQKISYELGSGAPSLGAGVAGGVAGGLVGGAPGSLAGGALGAAAGSAFQEVGPYFQRALQSGADPDKAWDQALEEAGTAGAFSGAGWALFPAKFFSGPLKNLAFQAFGIQPGLQVAGQAAQNIEEGRPVGENLPQAYGTGVATTAVPMLGHAALRGFQEPAPTGPPPDLSKTPPQPNPQGTQLVPPGGKGGTQLNMFAQMGIRPDMVDTYRDIDLNNPPSPAGSDPTRWSDSMLGRFVQKFQRTFLPESRSEVSREVGPIVHQMIGEIAQGKDSIYADSEEGHNLFRKYSDDQNLEFMKHMAGEPTNDPNYTVPPELQKYVPGFKNLMNMVRDSDANMGVKYGLIDDYFPRIYTDPAKAGAFFQAMRKNLATGDFQKKRTLDLIQDGLNNGLQLKYSNPADVIAARLIGSAEIQARMRLMQRMNQAGYATKMGETMAQAKTYNWNDPATVAAAGWYPVKDPAGQAWAIHPDLKPMWDNVIGNKSLWSDPGTTGSLFRGWMSMKNFYVPIKLALSMFHPLHVAHINMNDAFVRGWQQLTANRDPIGALGTVTKGLARSVPFSPAFQGEAKFARNAWLTPEWKQSPEQKQIVQWMTEGGFSPQLSEELRNNFKRQLGDAWAKNSPLGVGYYGLRHTMSYMSNAIFDKWIPSLKTASYLDGVRALLQHRPDLINDDAARKVALQTIARSVDNRYGEMFYNNLFWNRALKDAGIGSFLSLGWNLGFAREFGGGLLEPLLNKLQTGTPTRDIINQTKSKSAFALSYMSSAMLLNAMISYQFGGVQPQDMNYMDYLLPRVGGNNPDGSPRRVSNMFYTREIPMLEKHVEDAGGNWFSGAKEMLWNKMMFEPFNEMLKNRDYYGYNIWDENAPYYKQIEQAARYVLSDQFNPITYAGAKRALEATGKLSPNDTFASTMGKVLTNPEGLAAIAGFGPAPTYASRSQVVNRINYLYQHYVAPSEKPQIERDRMQAMREARSEIAAAKASGDSGKLAQATATLNELTGRGKARQEKLTPDEYMFSRLPVSVKADVLSTLNKQDFIKYFGTKGTIGKQQRAQLVNDPRIGSLVQRYYSQ